MKKYDRHIKTALIIATVAALGVMGTMQWDAQKAHHAMNMESARMYEEMRPFGDCIIAAATMINEFGTEEENQAAFEAESLCYRKFHRGTPPQ